MINGVLFRLIETSLPRPDPTPSASARIKFPLLLEPNDHFVSPFTFLVLRVLNSSSVNSKTFKTSEYEVFILSKNIKIILKKSHKYVLYIQIKLIQ